MAVVQYTFTRKQYIEQYKYQQYIEQQKEQLIRKSAGRAPSLRVLPGIYLTTEEKARKNLSQGSRKVIVYMLHITKTTTH